MTPYDLAHASKAQWIRVADVFVVGPLMVAGGLALHRRGHTLAGALLGAFGVGTVLLNGWNYWRLESDLRTTPIQRSLP